MKKVRKGRTQVCIRPFLYLSYVPFSIREKESPGMEPGFLKLLCFLRMPVLRLLQLLQLLLLLLLRLLS